MAKKTTTKKKYTPSSKEKYMCTKHKKFFTEELLKWKKDIIKANNLGNLLNSSDESVSSADIVDQASSFLNSIRGTPTYGKLPQRKKENND